MLVGPRAERRRRVEGAGVDVAGLQADDCRSGQPRQIAGGDAALAVDRQHQRARAAEAEQAEHAPHRRVHLGADDHRDRRRAVQPVVVDVPAGARQHRVPGRGQRGEVGHRRADDERAAAVGREPQRVERPAQRRRLDRRRRRRHHVQRAVLIPGRGQPVRRDGHRQRAAVDEAEVAAARHRDRGRRAEAVELIEDVVAGRGRGRAAAGRSRPARRRSAASGATRRSAGGSRGSGRRGGRRRAAGGGGKRFRSGESSVIVFLHGRE